MKNHKKITCIMGKKKSKTIPRLKTQSKQDERSTDVQSITEPSTRNCENKEINDESSFVSSSDVVKPNMASSSLPLLSVSMWFMLIIVVTCCAYQRHAYVRDPVSTSMLPTSIQTSTSLILDYTGARALYHYWFGFVIQPVYASLKQVDANKNIAQSTVHSKQQNYDAFNEGDSKVDAIDGTNEYINRQDDKNNYQQLPDSKVTGAPDEKDNYQHVKEKVVFTQSSSKVEKERSKEQNKEPIPTVEVETLNTREGKVLTEISSKNKGSANYKPIKKILLWTGFFDHADFEFGFGQQPFIDNGCQETRCTVTNDRKQYSYSDVVIFHMREVRDRYMPSKPRPMGQRWAFMLKESPWNSWVHQFKSMKSVFNWTITYRIDSDVPWLYGTFRHLSPEERAAASAQLVGRDYSEGKSKLVSWFSSRCPRISERDEYAAELAKFVPLDIYGRCGTLKCPGTSCYHLLNSTYKFYLAFENSICHDYITERLFRTMQHDVVPIVLGGGDYKNIAPQHSFIDVRDYPSPRHLARYLKYLDRNHTAYNEYFLWKLTYAPVNLNEHYKHQVFCDLCKKLHNDDEGEERESYFYPDIQTWWNREDCEGGIFDHLRDLHGVNPH